MKKILLVVASLVISFSSFSEGTQSLRKLRTFKGMSDKNVVSNGLYLYFGLGFPGVNDARDNNGADSKTNLGPQFSLELGNQWLFYTSQNEKFGIGMNVSWFSLGYSSYTSNYNGVTALAPYNYSYSNIYLNLLRFGPTASFGFTEKLGIDLNFNVVPTAVFSGNTTTSGDGSVMLGALFAPGIKFRYDILTVGFETQFGNLRYKSTNSGANDTFLTPSVFIPRILLGMKF